MATESRQSRHLAFKWDTESRGPARKVYTLTPAGWKRLEFWRSDIERRHALLQIFLDHFKRSKTRRKAAGS